MAAFSALPTFLPGRQLTSLTAASVLALHAFDEQIVVNPKI